MQVKIISGNWLTNARIEREVVQFIISVSRHSVTFAATLALIKTISTVAFQPWFYIVAGFVFALNLPCSQFSKEAAFSTLIFSLLGATGQVHIGKVVGFVCQVNSLHRTSLCQPDIGKQNSWSEK